MSSRLPKLTRSPERFLHTSFEVCTLRGVYWRSFGARTARSSVATRHPFGLPPRSYHDCCHHNGRLRLSDLPDWDWYDISAHLRCTKCGTVGFVDTRLDWTEVINFSKSTECPL